MSTSIALQRTVMDLVQEHDEKRATAEAAARLFDEAVCAVNLAANVGGAYSGPLFDRGRPSVDPKAIIKSLRISGWKATYERLSIARIASAADKREYEKTIEDPPEFTFDNAKATFGRYLENPRFHVLRGLAECFAGLDPAYKSHSKVKIGVKGLPKRMILNGWGEYSFGWGRDKLRDILNALRAVQGQPLLERGEFEDFCSFWKEKQQDRRFAEWSEQMRYSSGALVEREGKLYKAYGVPRIGSFETADGEHRYGTWREIVNPHPGVEIRTFGTTQTCHVIFGPETLLLINRALAEFYGEVLPDAESDEPPAKRPSTNVSKDLQFYPTPAAVIARVLDEVDIVSPRYGSTEPPRRVLEPSCGDGRILDGIVDRGHRCYGIEVHLDRSRQARAKGHPVMTANFLEVIPKAEFDAVVMNPPFSGQHWRKHLAHALLFLKPGGRLACILPATAQYDHDVAKAFGGKWTDLPVASFAESGTNVPTGFLTICKPKVTQ